MKKMRRDCRAVGLSAPLTDRRVTEVAVKCELSP